MPEIVEKCPLCGHEKNKLFDSRVFHGLRVENRVCLHCGLVFQSPRMTGEEQETFYHETYRKLYQGNSGPTTKDIAVQRSRADAAAVFAGRYLPKPVRMLDIGASSGLFLERARDDIATEVAGIEPGRVYREYAQSKGLKIYASLEEMYAAGENRFGLVSMMHVLEHMPYPVATLRELREKVLDRDGYLLVEVPNLYCHDSFEVAHMTAFSMHTLGEVMEKAGYEIVAAKKHGLPRSAILPLYLTVLAKPAEKPHDQIVPEHFVPVKRWLGLFARRVLQKLFPEKAWIPMPELNDKTGGSL